MSIEEQLANAVINIAVIRKQRNESGLKLAKACNLKSAKRVNDLEDGRGRLTIDELVAIADYFGVSIDGLLKKKAVVIFE